MIKDELTKILRKAGVEGEIIFSAPPKPEMGDLAFACFDVAKDWGMPPVDAAKKIQSSIFNLQSSIFDEVKTFGPYVNFFINPKVLAEAILTEIKKQGKNYGHNNLGGGKTVIFEYPSNNTHKELHVGHLRNICIGNCLVRLFAANGFSATPINYLNDFGAHVAWCLWGLMKFHAGEKPPRGQEQKWLGEIYTEASQYLAKHEEEKTEVYQLQTKLEARDKSIWPLYKKTRAWSIKKFDEIFKELGVRHQAVFYEKDVKEAGQRVVDELLRAGIAKIGEGGAIIIDLTKEKLDIALLRKSNGAGLYLTSDLGLAQAKNRKFPNITESIHLTGSEQNFYFRQLFYVLNLAGYHYKMKHVGYGLFSLSSGKMSSRAGNVLLYEDLRDEVYGKLYTETKTRHADWNEKKIATTARTLALAAMKFEILKHEAEKNIVFDPQRAASFDGFTGPYALYTLARINSIFRKARMAKFGKINYERLKEPAEKNLLLFLAQFPEVVAKAFASYNPSGLAKYAFDLSQAYNDFYNKHSVLAAADKELARARLALCAGVKSVLLGALSLLGIDTVGEM